MMRAFCVIAAGLVLLAAGSAQASHIWNWHYAGAGIAAEGTLTTSDTANSEGFYEIIGITGARNGAKITGLQPSGTAIPGNSGYPVDNLISRNRPQLTGHGFGFSIAGGDYANPFYNGSSYLEYVASPPYPDGKGSELPVRFSAKLVPEADSAWVLLAGLFGLLAVNRSQPRR